MKRLWIPAGALLAMAVALGQAQPLPAQARFHHVHLNTHDRARSLEFYELLGALPVTFGERTEAIFTGRGFILATETDAPLKPQDRTALRHLGWAGVDGPHEYARWQNAGLEVHTPIAPVGPDHFYYLWGPDREIVEFYTGDRNHWFNHLHFWSDDVAEASAWYERHLGQSFRAGARVPRPAEPNRVWGNEFRLDGISFLITYKDHYYVEAELRLPQGRTLEPSGGSPIDHLAFSYESIAPVYERMQRDGVEIVRPLAESAEFGFDSFMVNGPDGVLVEIVEAEPVPDGLWR
ncbi:MAG: VOC family protein [Acidobacteria bacterium]|nr:VOC family protein [Acidobacteriota bacterium]